MKKIDGVTLLVVYVLFGLFVIWSMIDSPWKWSASAEMNAAAILDLCLIVFSLYMFGSGFVMLATDMNRKAADRGIHRAAAIRMILAILFGVAAQWFIYKLALVYLN